MKTLKYLFFILCLPLFAGCFEDETTVDTVRISEISIDTLKMQKVSKGGSAAWIRQGLVIFQFTMAFILICSTFVIYLQIQLVQKRDIGIKKENLVSFPATEE